MWKGVVWDHSDHEIWTTYMWSASMDWCSSAFSLGHTNCQKITNLCTVNDKSGLIVPDVQICDSCMCYEFSEVSGAKSLYGWSKDHMYSICYIGQWCLPFSRNVICSYMCMYNGQYSTQNDYFLLWKSVIRDNLDHEIWTKYMSLRLWIGAVLHFLRDTNFQKITNLRTFDLKSGHIVPWAQIWDYRLSHESVKWMVQNLLMCGLESTCSRYMKCYIFIHIYVCGPVLCSIWLRPIMNMVDRDQSGHEIWIPCMWSTSMDQWSPAFFVCNCSEIPNRSTFNYKSGSVTNLLTLWRQFCKESYICTKHKSNLHVTTLGSYIKFVSRCPSDGVRNLHIDF